MSTVILPMRNLRCVVVPVVPIVVVVRGWEELLSVAGEEKGENDKGDAEGQSLDNTSAGDVVSRGSFGRGGTLGFRYLSLGSMVWCSELCEETLLSRLWSGLHDGRYIGMLRTLTR